MYRNFPRFSASDVFITVQINWILWRGISSVAAATDVRCVHTLKPTGWAIQKLMVNIHKIYCQTRWLLLFVNIIYLPLAVDIEFKIQADDVGYISPVAGDKVAVTVDTKNLELLQVYSLNSGRIICSVGDKEMKGIKIVCYEIYTPKLLKKTDLTTWIVNRCVGNHERTVINENKTKNTIESFHNSSLIRRIQQKEILKNLETWAGIESR